LAGIAAGVLTTTAILIVGIVSYQAGERSERTVNVVGEVVANGEDGRTVLVPTAGYGWHDGWHGPGPGFLLFPLIVIGLILLFASRRGGWRGPHRYGDDDLREWHRRQHRDEPIASSTSNPATSNPATSNPAT
jgi:hypothetical protein